MENSKRESIPMQDKLKLCKSQGASTPAEVKRMQNVPYASANPGELYWTAVKNIPKYIQNTKDMFLVYRGDIKQELRVACYTDVGYMTDVDDTKSQTGYVFILNGGAVDWKSTKQRILTTSFEEVEYIVASDASIEDVWIRKFIYGFGVVPTNEVPMKIYCENTEAITIANELEITKGARHYCVKVHYLREVIEFGDIVLEKVNTDDNVADPFTKALPFNKHSEHTKNIGKTKLAYAPKSKIPPLSKKDNPAKDATCHQCSKVGILTIELHSFPSRSCRYEMGYGTHICNTTQRLSGSKNIKPRALNMYVGNGHRASSEAIGTFHLFSLLKDNSFVNCFIDNGIYVSKDGLLYFHVIPRDGIYEINLHYANSNDSSIYAVSNKRAKLNLDSTLLWHCRLGHISKKQTEKFQHDGLINSTDIESFDKYVSCLSDDFSRYGYVYLLKHKHEVFETFKEFQKEVENQLGKTIKLLRSDRGGEYMSQEFLDHLKEHGIITHRTPPYTPHHNGMSERRNRILLDMNMLITQEESGSFEDLEIIQDGDKHPSKNTSLHHDEDDQEIDEPQSDIIHVRRFTRIQHDPDRMCLYIDAEEHELGDLNKLANYRAALLDLEYEKWLAAMNILKVFHMENSKHGSIPIQDKPKLCKSQDASTPVEVKRVQRVPYASIVGFIIIQGIPYWTAFKNILKYLHNIKDMFLVYEGDIILKICFLFYEGDIKQELRVACYIDARYLKDVDDTKSHSRYVFVLNGVIKFGDIVLEKVHTYDNVADPFTKALASNKHSEHTMNIGKTKLAYAPMSKIPRPPKKHNPAKSYLKELVLQGLRRSKKLMPGALNLYIGNGHRASLEAIGTFHLFSLLKDNGFVNCFIDNGISISRDGLLYFHAILLDGIYEIDLHCGNSNDSSIYAVSNKTAK
ncbi:retrotransposon protein, putative, ty1-copia subclass [Tanacetum coccineum]